jgi:spermidine/putrescine transport system permease protein
MKVTLPLSLKGIISGILMVFMPTVSMFAIRDVVTNQHSYYLFGNVIEALFSDNNPAAYGEGAAFAMILLGMVMVTMLISNLIEARRRKAEGGGKK